MKDFPTVPLASVLAKTLLLIGLNIQLALTPNLYVKKLHTATSSFWNPLKITRGVGMRLFQELSFIHRKTDL